MPEIATVHQAVQWGVETTPGTAVAANKKPQVYTVTPAIQAEVNTFRPSGAKFVTAGALGREWVEARVEGPLDYEHIVYLLSSVMSYAAPVQQDTTTAYQWTHAIAQSAEDTVKTYTVEVGDLNQAGKFTYGLVREMTITLTREEATVSATMVGQAWQDGITMTASPTVIPVKQVLPTQVDVYLDTTSTGIGTTRLTRNFRAELTLGERYGLVWPLNSSVSGFAAHVEVPVEATLALRVEADSSGMVPLTYLRSGDPLYVRIKATGPTISGSYTYSFQADVAGIVSEVGSFEDEDGVYAIEWTLAVTHDANWGSGKNLEVTVVNTRSAL